MSSPPSLSRRAALTDTGAYFALGVVRDSNHERARAIGRWLAAERWHLYTTNFILAETHALYLNRVGHWNALRALKQIVESNTSIIRITAADERRAMAIVEQYDDKDFTYTDATSFAVMERLGIRYAFTFDRNFNQYGFTVLNPAGWVTN
jgi:predicted nucleic acid-binding protein